MAMTPGVLLDMNGESGHPFFSLDFRAKSCNNLPLSMSLLLYA